MNKSDIIHHETGKSLAILKSGGTLLYPSDTIWGLGCDATNAAAIEKIYQLKKRPPEKSMIILIHDDRLLMKYVREVPEPAWDLVSYSERPLTIIYPGAINLPSTLIADDGTIAIRVVKDGFVHELLKRFNKPIISTSANISGAPAPLHFDEIDEAILGGVDYVVALQAAPDVSAEPSVIMKLDTNGSFRFIRR